MTISVGIKLLISYSQRRQFNLTGCNHDELKVVLVIQAIHFIGELGFRQVVFEGDSKLQIAALTSADVSWTPGSAGHLLDEAKMMAL